MYYNSRIYSWVTILFGLLFSNAVKVTRFLKHRAFEPLLLLVFPPKMTFIYLWTQEGSFLRPR